MSTVAFKCPKCKSGTIETPIDYGNDHGNRQSYCDNCETEFGFYFEVVIDGVYELDE